MACCRFLDWDSAFFGVRIARIDVAEPSAEVIARADEWCRREQIACLYVLADRRMDAMAGSEPVDVRVTLGTDSLGDVSQPRGAVRDATLADIPALRALAATNHHDTRFYADVRFAAQADQLYEDWIEKSVRGGAAAVLIPDEPGVTGYITCVDDGDGARIGLLGVATPARGRGLGRALIGAALDWFSASRPGSVSVVTQGRNTAARRAYEACGFAVVRTQYWYHRWHVPPA